MDAILLQILETAEKKGDAERITLLHSALTKTRAHSNYSLLPETEAQQAAEMAEAALARMGKSLKPKKRRRRPRAPAELNLSLVQQPDLFSDLTRWPRRPYCSDDPELGLRIRGLAQAITRPYIQANPPMLRVWAMFDIDRPNAAGAWQEADLLPPSWTAINPENGHAHSVWGLRAPVLVDHLGARDAPMRYLCAVESLMKERLGADQGFNGLITKNPGHPYWTVLRGPCMAYELSELAEALGPELRKHRPRRRAVEQVGVGRNVHLFDQLRAWAYRAIRPYWRGGLHGWNAWLSECNSRALVFNGEFLDPLGGKEVWHIARSVAKYTWHNTTAEGFSEWQAQAGAKGGRASGKVRRAGSVTEAAPWAAEGISRATWYRRQKSGLIVPSHVGES
jgi:hypothetical protein